MNSEWTSAFFACSKVLMRYGWFVAPYITGGEFERLKATCDRLERIEPSDAAALADAELAIFRVLSDAAYHPNNRAKYVRHALRLAHVREYSHLYEGAIFAYYKRDYAGSVLLLLVALEGILLALSGWQLGEPNRPGHNRLIAMVRGPVGDPAVLTTMGQARAMYANVFADFLEKWLYTHTNDADFGMSVLNRHYVMHGFEPGNFYRPQDVHRMILAFDVLIDWQSHVQDNHGSIFVEDDDPMVSNRMDYYYALSQGDQTLKQMWRTERSFLRDHVRYVAPIEEHDYEKSLIQTLLESIALAQRLEKLRTPLG